VLLDNNGYAMVRQTEEQWLGGVNVGTSVKSGLGFPDFISLAKSFGLPASTIERNGSVKATLVEAFAKNGPALIRVVIPDDKKVVPQVAFGYPIEDSEPFLPRDEFLANMKVAPMPVSLKPLARV
jgi:acetolactate synthase-1/2/3 large subunit